jgi:hypothetical protein
MSYHPVLDEYSMLSGLGAEPEPAEPDDAAAKEPRQLPTWAAVMIAGGLLAVVGAAIYYKYKLTSEIIAKHGVGKALAYEAGTTAIGVLGERASRR